jgi:hypothetical protein
MICNRKSGGRLFEPNPAWKCSLGPYGYGSSDSETYKYCTNPANREAIESTICCPGFGGGLPLNFKYSTESNGNWKNTRCDCLNCIPQYPSCAPEEINKCTSTNKNACYSKCNGTAKVRVVGNDVGVA